MGDGKRMMAMVGGAVALGLTAWFGVRPTAAEPAPGSGASAAAPVGQLVGTDRCSARACHGGLEPTTGKEILQDEYTKWLLRDDHHTRAYRTLQENPLSAKIMAHLGWKTKAYEEPRCLACHTNPLAVADSTAMHEERFNGVGCEACHGPASGWIAEHTKPDWKQRTNKQAFGMIPVELLPQRAAACVGCHIGAPAENGLPLRDMNHDLIAAGHPRLSFELGAFQANLPPHWDVAKSRKRNPDAQVWKAGQIASAAGALKLLADRAAQVGHILEKPSTHRPWPEFAEYNCFACHHDLASPSWRQERKYRDRIPGALPWGTWYYSALPYFVPSLGQSHPAKPEGPLHELRRALEKPGPNREEVGKKARQVIELLANAQPGSPEQAFANLAKDEEALARADWDGAVQLYLAAAALGAGLPNDRDFQASLNELAKALAFRGHNSPKGYQPEEVRKELAKVLSRVASLPR